MTVTISELLTRPLVTKNTLCAGAQLQDTVKQSKLALESLGGNKKPEPEAVIFYLLNHAWAEIKMMYELDEPLAPKHEEVANLYFDKCTPIVERMFHYLLLICTRESRHCKNIGSLDLQKKYGTENYGFLKLIKGTNSGNAVEQLKDAAPNTKLGTYTEMLAYVFNEGNYSGGYGGKAWGEVAETLDRFVQGTYTPEMLVDTGWTLCHNNGPIFNKGMLYKMYSHELVQILDVQRSGQIPQLIHTQKEFKTYFSTVPPAAHKILETCRDAGLSSAWSTLISWGDVMKLGALGTYTQWEKEMKGVLTQPVPPKKPEAPIDESKFYYVTPALKVPFIARGDLEAA